MPGIAGTADRDEATASDGKPSAASVRVAKRKESHKQALQSGDWTKCKCCVKWKQPEEYNQGQAKCKMCNNDQRSLLRISKTQQMRTVLDKLRTTDPKQYESLQKSFVKARLAAQKANEKLKLSIQSCFLEWQSSTGIRKEGVGEMMWEGEYMEWAMKTAKGGYLSRDEAQALLGQVGR